MREYLDILKRHRWFIVQAVVVVALAAGLTSSLRTPKYGATSLVLLVADDNASGSSGRPVSEQNRHAAAQIAVVRSEEVAREAAKLVRGMTAEQIQARRSVSQRAGSDVLEISGTDIDPVRAREVANAVARGYIENRRRNAVAGLQRAIDEMQTRLVQLQGRIAELDARVGPTDAEGTSLPRPGAALEPPLDPTGPDAAVDTGGQPATPEALKAARYASAVQYQTLFARQQDLIVQKNLARGDAELISEARTPTEPLSPRPKRDAALGGLVGLLLGAGISFLREQLDTRIRDREGVKQAVPLQLLAQLPHDPEMALDPDAVAVLARPHSPMAESVRALRTSLLCLGVTRATKVIVVTSAEAGEGKSLVAANLAAAYAETEARTYLVCGDLRRSRLATVFPGPPSPGLSGLLRSAAVPTSPQRAGAAEAGHSAPIASAGLAVSAALLGTQAPNLHFLPPGSSPPNPAELLGSSRMRILLQDLSATADVVVIDTPPVLPVTDAAVLAAQADAVILVAAVGETHRDSLQQATAILEATGKPLLGVVLNKAHVLLTPYYDEQDGSGSGRGRKRGQRPRDRSGKSSQATIAAPTEGVAEADAEVTVAPPHPVRAPEPLPTPAKVTQHEVGRPVDANMENDAPKPNVVPANSKKLVANNRPPTGNDGTSSDTRPLIVAGQTLINVLRQLEQARRGRAGRRSNQPRPQPGAGVRPAKEAAEVRERIEGE